MDSEEYDVWKYDGISHEKIEFINEILQVTISCNDKKHIQK